MNSRTGAAALFVVLAGVLTGCGEPGSGPKPTPAPEPGGGGAESACAIVQDNSSSPKEGGGYFSSAAGARADATSKAYDDCVDNTVVRGRTCPDGSACKAELGAHTFTPVDTWVGNRVTINYKCTTSC
jgi:hypothetical protein